MCSPQPAREVVGMNKHALWICLVSALVAATSGCCEMRSFLRYPLGSCGAICDPTHCCDGAYCDQCGPACGVCGPACAPCGDGCVDAGCDTCRDTSCDACGGSSCGSCGGYGGNPCGDSCWSGRGPLSWLFGGLCGGGCCGSGCGEFYWSDFYSEPPDCCDPCDRCGNWTGGSCGYGGGCGGGCGGSGYCAVKPLQNGYAAGKVALGRQVANRAAAPRNRQVANRATAPSRQVANRAAAPTRQVANRAAPGQDRAVPAWALRDLQGPVITDPSSPYAPKLVSVTDHAASPTTESAPVEQTVSAQRPVVRQASNRQVVTPRTTYTTR